MDDTDDLYCLVLLCGCKSYQAMAQKGVKEFRVEDNLLVKQFNTSRIRRSI